MQINWTLVLKIVTGVIIVPIALIANSLWPWWQKAPLLVKILSGIIVLPITALAYILTPWWSSL